MIEKVSGVVTTDSKKDISELLNQASVYPVTLTALFIAESNLTEGSRARRQRAWPDWSTGLGQPAMKWAAEPTTLMRAADGTALQSAGNWALYCAWFEDAARMIAYVAPRLDHLMARAGGDALLACCFWNSPNRDWNSPTLDAQHVANRANYERGLIAAEAHRAKEEPSMPATIEMPKREDFGDDVAGFQKSLLEYAVAMVASGDDNQAVATLKTLNPVRYADLAPKVAAGQ